MRTVTYVVPPGDAVKVGDMLLEPGDFLVLQQDPTAGDRVSFVRHASDQVVHDAAITAILAGAVEMVRRTEGDPPAGQRLPLMLPPQRRARVS